MAASLATPETKEAVEKYIYDASMKSNVDRLQDKEKTGVFTGSYAINPLNGAKVPIWLSDYVLADYGTGAIMCVPAHDDRDFEFAKKFGLPIVQVISKDGKEIENMTEAYTAPSGILINSGEWNGKPSDYMKKEGPAIIEKMGIGIFPSALLGRADSHCTLPKVWKCAGSGGGAALTSAGCGVLRAHWNGRIPPGGHYGLGKLQVSGLRRRCQERDEHHASVGRFFLVFPPLCGRPQ